MTAPLPPPGEPTASNRRPLLVMEPTLLALTAGLPHPYAPVHPLPWSELHDELRRSPPATQVLVDPYAGARRGERFPCIRDLLQRFPSVPVVAVMELRGGDAADAAILLEWGISQLVAPSTDGTPAAVAACLDQAHAAPLKRRVEAALSRYVGRDALRIVRAAAEVAVEGGQAPELGARLRVGTRALYERCARAGLPPARQLQAWMRVLLAALLLDDPGRTVQSAAYAAGYRTDRSLRRAITAFLGVDSTTLRRAGAFATAAPAFDRVLRDAREAERERRSRRGRER